MVEGPVLLHQHHDVLDGDLGPVGVRFSLRLRRQIPRLVAAGDALIAGVVVRGSRDVAVPLGRSGERRGDDDRPPAPPVPPVVSALEQPKASHEVARRAVTSGGSARMRAVSGRFPRNKSGIDHRRARASSLTPARRTAGAASGAPTARSQSLLNRRRERPEAREAEGGVLQHVDRAPTDDSGRAAACSTSSHLPALYALMALAIESASFCR